MDLPWQKDKGELLGNIAFSPVIQDSSNLITPKVNTTSENKPAWLPFHSRLLNALFIPKMSSTDRKKKKKSSKKLMLLLNHIPSGQVGKKGIKKKLGLLRERFRTS